MSGVRPTSSSRSTSRITSPVDDASATIRFTSPKRVLSWWWSMSTTYGVTCSTSASGPSRDSFAQSSATSVRSPASAGRSRRRSSSGMNAYSCGSGARPYRYMYESLPSRSSASFVASSDPSASPSGFSCVVSKKRSCARSASATAPRSSFVVVWCDLIDQLRQAGGALDRRIVLEGQLRGPLHSELSRDPSLQDAVRRLESRERARALLLRAEHRHEDAG